MVSSSGRTGPEMDPLDFLEDDELLRFFRVNKTEMSCMERPHTFITQLRDHDLIREDEYKKMSRMKSKDNLMKALYRVLDWLETKRSKHIKDFWRCVFKETIMNHYPKLRMMHKSLMDGSFHFDIRPARVEEEEEEEETDEGKRKEPSEDEEEKEKKVKKKRKRRSMTVYDDDGEQAGPSSQVTAGQKKKSKKLHFSSPLKKGEKGDIWTWAIYKTQLPVTCGPQNGTLNRSRLAKGEKCIVVKNQWFTPTEFERFAGKESAKNWKLSIRCAGTTLGKLIEDGHLKAARFKGGCKADKKSLFPSDNFITVSDREEDETCEEDEEDQVSSSSKESTDATDEEGEVEEQTEQQPEASPEMAKKVFKVTCGALAATLHKNRFATGTRGKSIRTETSWMTPMEFVQKALSRTNASWRKEITWEGKPLSVLTEAKILRIHSLLCKCNLCKPDSDDVENEKNDDECCICKSEAEEEKLVVCDHCPRAFHQKCHLPHIEDAMLGDGSLWMCTFCLFRSYQDSIWSELTSEEAMSSQISQPIHMLRCQYLLLHLCCADEEQTFATNPTHYLSDYRTVVKTPMWLGKVADKLQRQLYKTVGEFVSDVQLIFTNCASYNRDNAEFLGMGERLKEFFDEDFKNVFNIHEQTVD